MQETILKGIITWSETAKQNTQAKKVYCSKSQLSFLNVLPQ